MAEVDGAGGVVAPVGKRRKVTNACHECYRRKQKCDRQQPCSNCISRNVAAKCVFHDASLSAQALAGIKHPSGISGISGIKRPAEPGHATQRPPARGDLGYSTTAESNAFMEIKKLLNDDEDFDRIDKIYNRPAHVTPPDARSQALLDTLPPERAVRALTATYFETFNWHYFLLERYYFDCLLDCFYDPARKRGIQHLSPDELERELRCFPALLFQVLGLAMQFIPGSDPALKELARPHPRHDYSDLGIELMNSLGRRGDAVTAVLTDHLRTSWLKNLGRGVDAWYSIGNAIRSAQELGLHHQQPQATQPKHPGVQTSVSLGWYEDYKKRLWMNLFIWDSLTAMILGRPRTINPDDCDVKIPVECNIPDAPSTQVLREPHQIGPNSVSTNLFLYRLSNLFHKLKSMKADKRNPCDFSVVDALDREVRALLEDVPAFLRHQHPVVVWDRQYPYLPQQREQILTYANLFLMALHRPHVAQSLESRRAAIQAAIVTLDSQRRAFRHAGPQLHNLFTMSFYTVDASILLSVITTMYMPANIDILQNVDRVLHQAVERLEIMEPVNPVARAGLGLLRERYSRFVDLRDQQLARLRLSPASHVSTVTPNMTRGSTTSSQTSSEPQSAPPVKYQIHSPEFANQVYAVPPQEASWPQQQQRHQHHQHNNHDAQPTPPQPHHPQQQIPQRQPPPPAYSLPQESPVGLPQSIPGESYPSIPDTTAPEWAIPGDPPTLVTDFDERYWQAGLSLLPVDYEAMQPTSLDDMWGHIYFDSDFLAAYHNYT